MYTRIEEAVYELCVAIGIDAPVSGELKADTRKRINHAQDKFVLEFGSSLKDIDEAIKLFN